MRCRRGLIGTPSLTASNWLSWYWHNMYRRIWWSRDSASSYLTTGSPPPAMVAAKLVYPICPRRQRRTQLPSPNVLVTYTAVAATMSHSSGDQPVASIQSESTPRLGHVVESKEHIMDSPPSYPERCTSPIESTQGAKLVDPYAPQPGRTGTPDGSLYPSLLEVTDPRAKRTTPASRHQGRTLDLCQVMQILQNPDRSYVPIIFQPN